jgi:Uma2 family endonuclease
MALNIQLTHSELQTRFNLERWQEILCDPQLQDLPYRIETDRNGKILMSPPPAPFHGSLQIHIGSLLRSQMNRGQVMSECPVSTSDGVKAIDVAWISRERSLQIHDVTCLLTAPEICVEIISPGNTSREIHEKRALYFEAGAEEVWICDQTGSIQFYLHGHPETQTNSQICPSFPSKIDVWR